VPVSGMTNLPAFIAVTCAKALMALRTKITNAKPNVRFINFFPSLITGVIATAETVNQGWLFQ